MVKSNIKKCKHEFREFANQFHSWTGFVSFYCIHCLFMKHIDEDKIHGDKGK